MKQALSIHGRIYLVAAIASLFSATTTAVLIYAPDAQAALILFRRLSYTLIGFTSTKKWVLFFHPQFAFIASMGIGLRCLRSVYLYCDRAFYLLIWVVTEMTQQAFVIDALNQYWRPGLLNSVDDSERTAYETLLRGFGGITDSQYFVLLFGFGVGTTLFGFAFQDADAFGKV